MRPAARPASLAAAALLGAGLLAAPAAAQPGPRTLPCAVGPHAKAGHLAGLRVEARLEEHGPRDIRYAYRAVIRNALPFAAEVVPALVDQPALRAATPALTVIPARGEAEVLLGWVPVSDPIRRGAPPEPEAVQAGFVLEHCVAHPAIEAPPPGPALAAGAAPPAGPAVARAGGARQAAR